MRFLFLLLLVILVSCENHSFESDKRQLIAKDVIRRQLHKARAFDITRFKQDTLSTQTDSIYNHSIQYVLDFVYTDSSGTLQRKKGVVLFTPDGRSVLNSRIIDQD